MRSGVRSPSAPLSTLRVRDRDEALAVGETDRRDDLRVRGSVEARPSARLERPAIFLTALDAVVGVRPHAYDPQRQRTFGPQQRPRAGQARLVDAPRDAARAGFGEDIDERAVVAPEARAGQLADGPLVDPRFEARAPFGERRVVRR